MVEIKTDKVARNRSQNLCFTKITDLTNAIQIPVNVSTIKAFFLLCQTLEEAGFDTVYLTVSKECIIIGGKESGIMCSNAIERK